ncbi:MAG: SGNH/GDSL hydrolase family protein [Nitrospinae bacterium]|nr:SGNH/GDSL hydrolase family protein [Nitrospinota bacterium]MBL7020785.1 SGNH/GDSL hydrolase family protein [Nitrospinaceae bacterium]
MAPLERSKTIQSFCFSIVVVFFFFGFIELLLRLSGFEPVFRYKSYTIPSWMEEMDPVVLEKYQEFVAGQGFVSEDAYAYEPDLRYGYRLKPNFSTTVQNYSSALMVDKLPPWTIVSDAEGFRVPSMNSTKVEASARTLYVLGDSSSFGWGVEYEKSYSALLTKKLNSISPFNLRNLSLPGFSSFQGKLLLQDMDGVEKGDWVILSYGWNDAYSSLQTDRRQYELRNSMAGKINWRLKNLLLFRWMRSFGLPKRTSIQKQGLRVPLEQYRENLEALMEGVREKGGNPIFVNVCNPVAYQDAAQQTIGNKNSPFFNFPSALEPYLSTVHDRFPDLLVTYFEAYGESMEDDPMLAFLFPDRCHPNEIGHSLMAEVLFETFKKKIGNQGEQAKKKS